MSMYPRGGGASPGTPRRAVGQRLSAQEEEIIKVSFESFSEEIILDDKTGERGRVIMTPQLKEAFQAIDAEGDIHDVQLLIDDIDMNGDGKVDENEWRQIMMRKFLGEDDDSSIVHIFSMLDDNKDGYIPLVELRSILMREGQAPLSEQEVDELLMFADIESDGLINYRTFLRWLSAPQAFAKKPEPVAAAHSPYTGTRPPPVTVPKAQPPPRAEPPLPGPETSPPASSRGPTAGAAPQPSPTGLLPQGSPTSSQGASRPRPPQASPTSSQPQGSPTASESGDGRRGRRGRRANAGQAQG